jgi:hypothetical protein
MPRPGAACTAPPEVRCTFGTCGGDVFRCESGLWRSTFTPPPP